MPATPQISVLIPSYNHACFLPATLDSILAQSFSNYEVIIVDDGSSDDSLNIAQEYAAKHPLIRVLTLPGHCNQGLEATLNLAFHESQGDYIAWIGSDDTWQSDKLQREIDFLTARPDLGWVHSYVGLIDEAGHTVPGSEGFDLDWPARRGERLTTPMERLIQWNLIVGTSVLARRAAITATGLFDATLVYSDWDFWLRLLNRHKLGFIPVPLVYNRVHNHNMSRGIGNEKHFRHLLAVMQAVRQKAPTLGRELAQPRLQALLDLQAAYLLFCLGDKTAAQQQLSAAFTTDPTLSHDTDYLADWLKQRVRDHIQPSKTIQSLKTAAADQIFADWAVARLIEQGIPLSEQLTRQIKATEYAHAAFQFQAGGKYQKSRQMMLRSLRHDPGWLRDRAFQSLLMQACIGSHTLKQARHLKHRLLRAHPRT